MTHRHDDPETSVAAAATADHETHRELVEGVFRRGGCALTAEEVERVLAGRCSPSSVRREVRALWVDKKIVPVGEGRNRSGCKAVRWRWKRWITPRERRLIQRLLKDAMWRPPIRMVEDLQGRGWMIQLEFPLQESPIAYVEKVHKASVKAMLAEAAEGTNDE